MKILIHSRHLSISIPSKLRDNLVQMRNIYSKY